MSTYSLEEALANILAAIEPIAETEIIPAELALGRITASPAVSAVDLPPFTQSAMDGYAVCAADITQQSSATLQEVTVFAGKPTTQDLQPRHCIRIMTGGRLPQGADSVVMQERVQKQGQQIQFLVPVTPGDNIRLAGEELRAGYPMIPAGKKIGPAEMGLLATGNCLKLEVFRRIRVAFFSSGDELRVPGEALQAGQIYDANRPILRALLTEAGCECVDLGVIADQPQALRQALLTGAQNADVVLTSGGVSVGDADYIQEILAADGNIVFWKVAIKPGHPLAFGRFERAWLFGLPGNPVSTMVTCVQLALPAIRRLSGETENRPGLTIHAQSLSRLSKKVGRREFQRGILQQKADGTWQVESTGNQSSGMLSSLSRANCFIVLPEQNSGVHPGDWVQVQPFQGLW